MDQCRKWFPWGTPEKEEIPMNEVPARSYYRDYVTPEAWQELRRFLTASAEKAVGDARNDQALLLGELLGKMDELVAPVPRVVPAQQPRVEHGASLGGVFISETILGELQDRGTRNSEVTGDAPILLERNVGEALAKYGLAVQQTRGGWRGTELIKDFMNRYDEEMGRKVNDGTALKPE